MMIGMENDLREIKERLPETTPGEWSAYIAANSDLWVVDNGIRDGLLICSNLGPDYNPHSGPNARFIAAAKSDVPALIAKVEELRAILAVALDDPLTSYEDAFGDTHTSCQFCASTTVDLFKPSLHKPDCPVLNRDRLLGRVGVEATG